MFGYVIPDRASLSPEAQSRYRSAYCGLCRRIDALHGLRGRFTLSYDLTFLNLLLCSLYEGRIVDSTEDELIVELANVPSRIDAFLDVISNFEIVEMSRSGVTAIRR